MHSSPIARKVSIDSFTAQTTRCAYRQPAQIAELPSERGVERNFLLRTFAEKIYF